MNNLFQTIADAVASRFPDYHVAIEEIPDSPLTRAIAVYDVAQNDIRLVKGFINDLDWELCQPAGIASLARVVNQATTAACYPQFQSASLLLAAFHRLPKPTRPESSLIWTAKPEYTVKRDNTELALAA